MTKLIIDIDNVSTDVALECVSQVMKEGRISASRGIPQFCFLTCFETSEGSVTVRAKDRRSNASADSFVVYKP